MYITQQSTDISTLSVTMQSVVTLASKDYYRIVTQCRYDTTLKPVSIDVTILDCLTQCQAKYAIELEHKPKRYLCRTVDLGSGLTLEFPAALKVRSEEYDITLAYDGKMRLFNFQIAGRKYEAREERGVRDFTQWTEQIVRY